MEATTFNIAHDPIRYQGLEARAALMLGHIAARTLPDGEPERGMCSICPIKSACDAHSLVLAEAKEGELPLDIQLEAESIVEELKTLQDPRSDLDMAREKEAKEDLKKLLAPSGYRKVSIGLAQVALIEAKGRETVDPKGLKAAHPDIYKTFLKTGAPSVRIDISWE